MRDEFVKAASCQKAVGPIQSWCRAAKLPVLSSDTSSYCKARCRLRLSFLQGIHQRVITGLNSRTGGRDQWHGFALKTMDGRSIQLMDTGENQLIYPQPSAQKPGCGFPTMGIVGLLNLSHGGWEHIETRAHTQHGTIAAATLATHLAENDLLLADRAFCSYELIARCRKQGAHILMRLHQTRDKALDWRRGRRVSHNERVVTWKRPQQPCGSSLTREEWDAIPGTMELRLIRFRYGNRAGKKAGLTVVTTLLDAKEHSGEELADLYARRWEIELKLLDLKTTLGMERFDVKSPVMEHKTLCLGVIAYNLIRALMQNAAAVSQIVSICATKLTDIRPFRLEPWAVKRRSKPYHLPTEHRSKFIGMQHRERYRKSA